MIIMKLVIRNKKWLAYSEEWIVDNNLGPDFLTGPKALDPNYCRQPTH